MSAANGDWRLTQAELAATRQPVERARLLPPRVFHDREIFALGQQRGARTWLYSCREPKTTPTAINVGDCIHN